MSQNQVQPMPDISARLAILVVSCDKYRDLWDPFFSLFQRFWPDCPLPVYLLSNTLTCHAAGVKTLLSGEDRSWSDSLRRGISELKEPYVLLFLDDLLLCDYVRTDRILNILSWFIESGEKYLRMSGHPLPDAPLNDLVGVIAPGSIYRASTVLSVWRKDILLALLKPGESAWHFEIHGSVRSDAHEGFYSTWIPEFQVVNGIVKGKWRRDAVRTIRSLGVIPDLPSREAMTLWEAAVLQYQEARAAVLHILPGRYRRAVKDFVLRGQYNYARFDQDRADGGRRLL